ncbi:MAG: SBBP repeat-containing protein [Bacteroidia bacterium]|nr:SBBP repeat-containing protein [Bacteroidia bacterium]
MKKQICIFSLAIIIAASVTAFAQNNSSPKAIGTSDAQNMLKGSGMMFTQNKGQIADTKGNLHPEILYKGDGGGADVYLRKTGVSYVTSNRSEVMHEIDKEVELRKFDPNFSQAQVEELKRQLEEKAIIKIQRTDVDFEGSNPNPQTLNEEEVEGYTNYYYAHCPSGITNVKSYNRVVQRNIYNGIDVIYHGGKQSGLKYDIVVNPGADPNQIKLQWKGAENIQLNEDGRLEIKTSVNEFYETLPKVYQLINGEIVDIKAKYKVNYPIETHNEATVSFYLQAWNQEFPLVIDPWVWATYCGGNAREMSGDISVDASGNALITGTTYSANFPSGAAIGNNVFQSVYSGAEDVIVAKFSPAGTRLWATYYGGSSPEMGMGGDLGEGIDVDGAGNVVVTGRTMSSNFPVGASAGYTVFQSTFNAPIQGGQQGGADAFVLKFSPSGLRLFGTYYGGTIDDVGADIATDASGNILFTGNTGSSDFPITAAAGNVVFQSSFSGGSYDAFIAKMSPIGTILWSTYYGGVKDEFGTSICIDLSGSLFVTGQTNSLNFPIGSTAGNSVLYTTLAGGIASDAFIIKLSPAGGRLWSTFYGGSSYEFSNGITTDPFGNVFIVGSTLSANFPIGAATGNVVFQSTYGGGSASGDAFIVKLTSTGQRLWATFHGGSADEIAFNCATDSNGNLYVMGDFEDFGYGNFSMNTCALQPVYGGGSPVSEDWFVTKFKSTGERLCSTFIGGTTEDELDSGGGIDTYQNFVYVSGSTDGSFPVTAGSWQPTFAGGAGSGFGEIVLGKFCGNSCGAANSITTDFNSPASMCRNSALQFTAFSNSTLTCDPDGQIYKWYFPGANPSTSSQKNPNNIIYPTAGTYTVSLVVYGACNKDSIAKVISITNCNCNITTTTSVNSNVTCYGYTNGVVQVTISNGSGGAYTYSYSNGQNSITSSTTSQATGLAAGTYSVTITDGSCKAITSVTITQPNPLLLGTSTKWSCPPATASITASGNTSYTYAWSNGGAMQTISNVSPGNYTVTVRDQNNCSLTQSVSLSLPPVLSVSVNKKDVACNSSGWAQFTVSGVPAFFYTTSNGLSDYITTLSGGAVFTLKDLSAGTYTVTLTDALGCTETKTVTLTSTSTVSSTFTYPLTACVGDLVNFIHTGTPPGSGISYTWEISPVVPNPTTISGSTTDFSYTFLSPGIYKISHKTVGPGCYNVVANYITVTNCSGPTITATGSSICSGTCATVKSSASGGSGTYTYSWNTGATTKDINPCPATTTTYTVKVTDSGGKTATSTAVVTVNPAVTVTATSTNITCSGKSDGGITATPGGGTPAFNYVWSNGITTSSGSNLVAGNYTVTVIDSKGCTAVSTTTITAPPALLGQYTKGTANCNNCGCKEWIMLNATGGTSPYTYTWPDGYDKRYKNALCPGVYNVIVTDNNGCKTTVKINAP